MFSGKCELKFYKKTNEWKNSTGSVRVELENGLAWSYGQKIAIINKEKDFVLFNEYKFSQTTSNHQKAVYVLLQNKLGFHPTRIFRIEAGSLNYFDGSIDSIKDSITSDLNLDRLQSSKLIKFSHKELTEIKSRLDEDFKKTKENEKENRLKKNLITLNYANEKTYLKALNEFFKNSGRLRKLELDWPQKMKSLDHFELFEKIMENKEISEKIDPVYYLREILEYFMVFNKVYNFEECLRRYLKAYALYSGHQIIISQWKIETILNKFSSEEKTEFLKSVLHLEKLDFSQCKEIVNQTKTASIFEEIGEMA